MLGSFAATIEVARPHNMIAAAACVASGYFVVGGRVPADITLPLVFTALVVGLGNIINDVHDADIDRVNKPRRPIPSGRLTESYVHSLYWIGSIVLSGAAFAFLHLTFAFLIVIWQMLLYLYSWKAKRLPLVGNLLVSAVASSAFLFGAAVAGTLKPIAFPVIFAFMFMMGRELVKEAEDLEGDKQVGASTLPVRLGVERTVLVAVIFLLFCAIVAPLPVLLDHYGGFYAALMEIFFVPGLLVASYLVLNREGQVVLNRVSWILKIELFFGIIAVGLGKL
ncbi:MAG: digeranylgeranylglyceryl phosphate synthase [Candidatus Latescibacteria bacterium]|nr:digeranylgeranylglyceryl phosphate synthase [Candidatus Latescibacterota bacterium]NIM21054.1 digeranylgeranylglyceryl phosphate synthase [Candidatus Latescibacterota bacterium]NIM65189.1 digeranylgeranylglyceryl phosphate synthase [Candidatus Latescibacterota bacterium]NIO01704.1 digeranylgeranylglyceryl phosphate synthase [Candidatus Latescibacterota bacterium]NIO28221.1 digeranylgeranylglyceryl phosphate synthase [Candidatus Latescibacterota bacterium]